MKVLHASTGLARLAAAAALAWPLLAQAAMANLSNLSKDTQPLPECSWDRPGHNPFYGDVVAAVDRYTDIPADVRARLKQRMAKRDYDDIASIRRDSIDGKASYEPALRDMHFGTGRVCANVSRQHWLPAHQERGLVYCEGAECIIVPTVCRNVSRITRKAPAVLASREPLERDTAAPGDELLFPAPGAGPLTDTSSTNAVNPPGDGSARAAGVGPSSGGTTDSAGPGAADGNAPLASGPFGGVPFGNVLQPVGGRLFDVPVLVPVPVVAVPEPGTWALLVAGLVAAGLVRSQRSLPSRR
jgi:hypothetical protein